MTAAKSPPTPQEFYISYPLYQKFTFSKDDSQAGWEVAYSQEPIDTYCPQCGMHSIFRRHFHGTLSHNPSAWEADGQFAIRLKCSRDAEHELYFMFKVEGRTMQKIGQYPSLADLNTHDVRQYAAVLDKADFNELNKAIGLAAHGVGVGSFVYLRRIFENLVDAAYQIAKSDDGWNDEAYRKGRMAERIQLLAGHLPDFLVENHLMYKILSQGLHELTEDDCLAAFPVLKMGIELVLDEKLAAAVKQQKLDQAKKAIHDLVSKASAGQ